MKLLDTIKNSCEMAKFTLQKNSPTILKVGGIIFCAVGGALVAYAGYKSAEEVRKAKEKIEELDEKLENDDEYTEEEHKQDKNAVVREATFNVTKKVVPATAVLVGGVSMLVGSNSILEKRNIGLTTAYTTLDGLFKTYRENVKEELGEEADLRYLNSIKVEKTFEKVTDENGNEVEVSREIWKSPKNGTNRDIYTAFIDPSCALYKAAQIYTINDVLGALSLANHRLRVKGFMFINEVREMLQLPLLPAEIGYRYGWKLPKNGTFREDYISFGDIKGQISFRDGYSDTLFLEFNIDGPIADMMSPEDYNQYGNYNYYA